MKRTSEGPTPLESAIWVLRSEGFDDEAEAVAKLREAAQAVLRSEQSLEHNVMDVSFEDFDRLAGAAEKCTCEACRDRETVKTPTTWDEVNRILAEGEPYRVDFTTAEKAMEYMLARLIKGDDR